MLLAKFTYIVRYLPESKNSLVDRLSHILPPEPRSLELTANSVHVVDIINNYEKFYVNIIYFLKTGNTLLTVTKANIMKFKKHCRNYFLYNKKLIYRTASSLKRVLSIKEWPALLKVIYKQCRHYGLTAIWERLQDCYE